MQVGHGAPVTNYDTTDTEIGTTANPWVISGSISATTDSKSTAAAPSYLEGTSNPLSTNLAGQLRTITAIDQTTPGTTNAVDVTNFPVTVDATHPVSIDQIPVTITDHSIIGNATGSSQTLLSSNATRRSILIINPPTSATNWTIDPTGGAVVANVPPGITLRPGDSYSPRKQPNNAITGIGTSNSSLVVQEGN